ncbi:InlB B-repeat-containing protein, partial [Candidatus Saccharibacteria bacterium]|nr:InlB B-repeat-containing protein [Candidatus Saccharibacteria bacterium]
MSLKKLTGLAIVASILAVIVGFNAYAKTNIFSVENAIISDKSDAVDGEIVSYDGLNIVSNLTFHKLGDTATYKISLKNVDDVEHYIKTISDNNTNNNLSYLYESNINKTISAGEVFDFVVTVKYSTAVADAASRTQNTNVSFTIAYDNTEETLGIAPKTGDDILANIAIFVIASAGLIISIVLIIKGNKRTAKYVAVLMLIVSVLSVVATSANAANTNSNELTINSTVNFRDKVAVTYVIDGSEEIELVDYGSTINKELTARAGYKLSDWTLADGTVFDTNSKIFDDITLAANYTPITFTVAFDGHGARKGSMGPQTFTYGESQNLAANLFKKHGYGLDKWTTTADGEGGQSFANEQEISNLTTEDGATITLYAQWKSMPCNPNATHFDDTVCLQDIVNPSTIKTMPYDEQYQLRDSRDGRYYDVMRLIDGNIWMQEDLFIMDKTISSADSNLPEGTTFTIPASDMSAFTDDAYHPAVYDNGEYGVLYNFYTATAGWVTVESEGPSPMDICPKGWHIPSS